MGVNKKKDNAREGRAVLKEEHSGQTAPQKEMTEDEKKLHDLFKVILAAGALSVGTSLWSALSSWQNYEETLPTVNMAVWGVLLIALVITVIRLVIAVVRIMKN